MIKIEEKIPKTPDMFDHLIGQGCEPRWMEYSWTDVALYALSVGCTEEDLPYIFEMDDHFKALPTFGLVPYINSIKMMPPRREPYGPNEMLSYYIIDGLGGEIPNRLHMAEEIIMHRQIDPMGGRFITEDQIEDVLDWGDRGVVGIMRQDVYDRVGNPICTVRGTHYHQAFGNFGGKKFVSPKVEFPDRAPDYEMDDFIMGTQGAFYRLLGDTYRTHIDPNWVARYGFKKPIFHGLGTFGFAARMAIQTVIPYQPERVTRVYAQMRTPCYMGQKVKFVGWKADEHKVIFKLFGENDALLLSNGEFEFD